MGQQVVYVEGKGFIPIQSGQTVEQAIAAVQGPLQTDVVSLNAGPNKLGVNLPPLGQADAEGIINAIPQAAGMAAQFTPVGRSGLAAMAIPGGIEAIIEMIRDGKIDPLAVAGQAVMGRGGKAIGDAVEGFGELGRQKVGRALNLPAAGLDNLNSANVLPNVAIREGAQMTDAGVKLAQDRAAQTGSGALQELADALEGELVRDKTAKPRISFWPQENAANWLRRSPRQLAMGQAMAKARGMGPSAEAIARAMLTASQTDNPPRTGPRRRER